MKNYSINLKVILYLLIVYPFFKTYYFSQLGIMPTINQILFAVALMLITLFYLLKFPYIRLNGGIRFIIFYYTLIAFSTFLNGSIKFDFFSLIAFSIGFGLLVNYCMGEKKEFIAFLSAVYILLYIYIVSNLIAMLIYPNGLPSITENIEWPQYVFGNTNSVIKMSLPGLCFSFLHDLLKYKKIRKLTWLLLLLVWVTLIKSWSVTSMLGLSVFCFILFNRRGKRQSFFDYFNILIFSIVLFLMIVIFKYENNLMRVILDFFGKDLDFTGRDILWERAIDKINTSPFLGLGFQSEESLYTEIGNRSGSHNYYLDTLLRGGFISLGFLVFGIIHFGKRIVKCNTNLVTKTLVGTCCGYFIMWIAEPFISTEYLMFSILFVVISRIDIVLKYFNEP